MIKIVVVLLSIFIFASCNVIKNITGSNTDFDSQFFVNSRNITLETADSSIGDHYEFTPITINLPYSGNADATSCSASNFNGLSQLNSCTCTNGNCSVTVKSSSATSGAVSLDYTVSRQGTNSNVSVISFNILNIGATENEKWVYIPANSGGMGLSGFYVMQFEAKAWQDSATQNGTIDPGEVDSDGLSVSPSSLPVSIADNGPWRSIQALDSATKCESIGTNYRLISNAEWMAIARDVENVASNWSGGSVGSGCLNQGNTNAVVSPPSCGYDGPDYSDSGTSRNAFAIHTLSSGDTIYDLAGNAEEFVDWDENTSGFQIGPTACSENFTELPSMSCGSLLDSDYNSSNGSYTSTQGMGTLSANANGGITRGGFGLNASTYGIYSAYFGYSVGMSNSTIGFRCVFSP